MKYNKYLTAIFTVVATVILAGGNTLSALALPTNPPAPPPLEWSACPDAPTRDCATLIVPLDYANPSAGTIDLSVARARAMDSANRIGPLFFNLGGPGVPSVSTIKYGDLSRVFSTELVNRFDIIGFDPRGTSPDIECFTDAAQSRTYWEANHLAKTPAELQHILQLNSNLNQGCLTQHSSRVQHVNTASTVRDTEQLRRSMGIEQFSFIGFSYGTFIGNRYAALYPGHLRAMVLDAVTDRSVSDIQSFSELTGAAEFSWQSFKQWCQNTPSCQVRGQNLDALFQQVVGQARTQPLPAPYNPYGNRPVNDWKLTLALQAVLAPGSVTYGWADEILTKAKNGDASLASLLYDSATGYNPATNSYGSGGAHRSITCSDTAWSQTMTSATKVQVLSAAMEAISPRFGKASVAQVPMQCFNFPVSPVEIPPVSSKVTTSSPTLVIGATKDVSTPYIWSARIAGQIKDARLLTRKGDGHVSLGKSRCVEQAVNNVLVRLTLSQPRAVCPTDEDLYGPIPPPVLEPTLRHSVAPQEVVRDMLGR